MDKKYICSLIETKMEELKSRILELEQRDINNSLSGNEANELACLKDYYNFEIFDNILQLIKNDHFSSLDNLRDYLRDEIIRCDIPEERVGADNDDVQVYTLKESNFNRIICLDTILFCIEFI